MYGVTSSGTPGPIVEHTVALLTYLPFATDGLAFTTASINACAFCNSFGVSKATLPTGAWMTPVLSTRNSTLPALISLIALTISMAVKLDFEIGKKNRRTTITRQHRMQCTVTKKKHTD